MPTPRGQHAPPVYRLVNSLDVITGLGKLATVTVRPLDLADLMPSNRALVPPPTAHEKGLSATYLQGHGNTATASRGSTGQCGLWRRLLAGLGTAGAACATQH